MKKIIVAGMLAFCGIVVAQQQAFAWKNSKFNFGLSSSFQSGGNSFLWGLWRNGQPPGPEAYGVSPYGGPQFGAAQFGAQPGFQTPAPQVYVPPGGGAFQTPYANPSAIGGMNQGAPFQFANYPRPVEYYYFPDKGYDNR